MLNTLKSLISYFCSISSLGNNSLVLIKASFRIGLLCLALCSLGCWTGNWEINYPTSVTHEKSVVISNFTQLDAVTSSTSGLNMIRIRESVQTSDASYFVAKKLQQNGFNASARINARISDLTPEQILVRGNYYPIPRSLALQKSRFWPVVFPGFLHIVTAFIFPIVPPLVMVCGYRVNVEIIDHQGQIIHRYDKDFFRKKICYNYLWS